MTQVTIGKRPKAQPKGVGSKEIKSALLGMQAAIGRENEWGNEATARWQTHAINFAKEHPEFIDEMATYNVTITIE